MYYPSSPSGSGYGIKLKCLQIHKFSMKKRGSLSHFRGKFYENLVLLANRPLGVVIELTVDHHCFEGNSQSGFCESQQWRGQITQVKLDKCGQWNL